MVGNAASAGELLRPLILYYGAMALARGRLAATRDEPAAEEFSCPSSGGEGPPPLESLNDCPGEHVQRQVVWAAGFGVGAAHTKTPEGLDAYQGAGDLAVEVDVAGPQLVAGELEVVAVFGVDAAGEAVGVVVGDAEGISEVAGLYDRENGAEDLLLRHPRLGVYLEEGGRHEVALCGVARVLAEEALALLLAHLYVAGDLLELRLANDGAHPDVHAAFGGHADLEGLSLLDDLG